MMEDIVFIALSSAKSLTTLIELLKFSVLDDWSFTHDLYLDLQYMFDIFRIKTRVVNVV